MYSQSALHCQHYKYTHQALYDVDVIEKRLTQNKKLKKNFTGKT